MKIYKLLLFLLITPTTYGCFVKPTLESMQIDRFLKHNKQKTWLLSSPTCGNTWLRYSIEHLTKRPTLSNILAPGEHFLPVNCPLGFSFPELGTDFNKAPIWKAHHKKEMLTITQYNTQEDKLILILRNHKEIACRYNEPITSKRFNLFFENIYLYDSWNPSKRLLITYEELITNTKETLFQVIQFLEEDDALLDTFIQEIDIHRERCLSIYKAQANNPLSRGSDPLYHSKKLSPDQKKNIDLQVQKRHPKLWNKYLEERYSNI